MPTSVKAVKHTARRRAKLAHGVIALLSYRLSLGRTIAPPQGFIRELGAKVRVFDGLAQERRHDPSRSARPWVAAPCDQRSARLTTSISSSILRRGCAVLPEEMACSTQWAT